MRHPPLHLFFLMSYCHLKGTFLPCLPLSLTSSVSTNPCYSLIHPLLPCIVVYPYPCLVCMPCNLLSPLLLSPSLTSLSSLFILSPRHLLLPLLRFLLLLLFVLFFLDITLQATHNCRSWLFFQSLDSIDTVSNIYPTCILLSMLPFSVSVSLSLPSPLTLITHEPIHITLHL